MSRDILQLAFAQLTAADALVVQLLRLEDMPAAGRTLNPAAVRIIWPLPVNQAHGLHGAPSNAVQE